MLFRISSKITDQVASALIGLNNGLEPTSGIPDNHSDDENIR
jgi:hypothetical protein